MFKYDPSQTSASFEVHPKGDYELQLGEPKSFIKKNRAGNDSYGVRYSAQIMDGPAKGKRTLVSVYLHSDGGQSFAKQLMLAALGFGRNIKDEQRFNEEHGTEDWSIDPETGGVGDGWRKLTGARIVAELDIQKGDDDKEFQQIGGYRTLAEQEAKLART